MKIQTKIEGFIIRDADKKDCGLILSFIKESSNSANPLSANIFKYRLNLSDVSLTESFVMNVSIENVYNRRYIYISICLYMFT